MQTASTGRRWLSFTAWTTLQVCIHPFTLTFIHPSGRTDARHRRSRCLSPVIRFAWKKMSGVIHYLNKNYDEACVCTGARICSHNNGLISWLPSSGGEQTATPRPLRTDAGAVCDQWVGWRAVHAEGASWDAHQVQPIRHQTMSEVISSLSLSQQRWCFNSRGVYFVKRP